VLGYVQIATRGSPSARSSRTRNYVPVGTTFSLYQAGEYDSTRRAAREDGLNYLFASARWAPVARLVELQTSYRLAGVRGRGGLRSLVITAP